jgi:NADH-quinone oxidoreductase subunit L
MVMAVGCASGAGMYHLVTHAFFKALLFLGAGSIIRALHHEQDIWKMGGLASACRSLLDFHRGNPGSAAFRPSAASSPRTASSPPPNRVDLFGLGVLVAALTAFYMARLFLVALRPFTQRAVNTPSSHVLWPLRCSLASLLAGFGAWPCSIPFADRAAACDGLVRPGARALRPRAAAASSA